MPRSVNAKWLTSCYNAVQVNLLRLLSSHSFAVIQNYRSAYWMNMAVNYWYNIALCMHVYQNLFSSESINIVELGFSVTILPNCIFTVQRLLRWSRECVNWGPVTHFRAGYTGFLCAWIFQHRYFASFACISRIGCEVPACPPLRMFYVACVPQLGMERVSYVLDTDNRRALRRTGVWTAW